MRKDIRERLNAKISRKQFLQYMAGAVLMVFGLGNLVSLLTGSKLLDSPAAPDKPSDFGEHRYGV